MNLSFSLPSSRRANPVVDEVAPGDLARLAAALEQPAPVAPAVSAAPLAPADGAFNAAMAVRLATWRQT